MTNRFSHQYLERYDGKMRDYLLVSLTMMMRENHNRPTSTQMTKEREKHGEQGAEESRGLPSFLGVANFPQLRRQERFPPSFLPLTKRRGSLSLSLRRHLIIGPRCVNFIDLRNTFTLNKRNSLIHF